MKIRKLFLRNVIIRTVLLQLVLIGLVTYVAVKHEVQDTYTTAQSIGKIAAQMLDGDRLAEYASTLEKDEEYELDKEKLEHLKGNFPDCKYMYIYVPNGDDTCTYIYDIYSDAEWEAGGVDAGDLGFMEEFTPEVMGSALELWETGEISERMDTSLHTKYGALAASYSPVYGASGEIRAIVGIDYSIRRILELVSSLIIIMVILLALSGIVYAKTEMDGIDKWIVKPIDIIEGRLSEYVASEHNGNSSAYRIPANENSENEIDVLGTCMNRMMQDMDDFIIRNEKEAKEKERIRSELDLAREIQATYLPSIFPPFPEREDFDIYATMDPAKEVGGDFYDFFLMDDRHLGLVIADVSGKGVGASLFMMISKTMLNSQAMFTSSPAEILKTVNNKLCANNEAQMFVTVWLGIIDLDTGIMKAANAGHEFPALMKANGDFKLIKDVHGFVLAGMEGINYKEYELQFEPGDRLYVYTDGVAEATNSNEELYGTDRIIDSLNRHKSESLKDMLVDMRRDIDDFVKEAPQFDDITMLTFEYRGSSDDNK